MTILTANRSDEEPWRIERLQRVLKKALEISESADPLDASWIQRNLLVLHDHKGELTAKWRYDPNMADGDAIYKAWRAEGELDVVHEIPSPEERMALQ